MVVQKTIFCVNTNAETFGRTIPKDSIIFVKETKTLWGNTAKASATDSIATLVSKVQLTVPAGTNAITDFKESVIDKHDASAALPTAAEGARYLCVVAGNGWNANTIYEYKDGQWIEDVTTGGCLVNVESEAVYYAKSNAGVFVNWGQFMDKRPAIETIEALSDNQTVFATTITLTSTLEVCVEGIETNLYTRDNANQITLGFGVSLGSLVTVKSFK